MLSSSITPHLAHNPLPLLCVLHIENENLNQAENVVYLGGSISEDASTDTDVKRRIGLASRVMQKLIPIWKAKEISRETKVKVYEVLVRSVYNVTV